MTRPGPLRVGVPSFVSKMTPASGAGRMWHNVLEQLSGHVEISTWDSPGATRFRVPPDV